MLIEKAVASRNMGLSPIDKFSEIHLTPFITKSILFPIWKRMIYVWMVLVQLFETIGSKLV